MVGVLFVCTGNICRSPTAEGVARKLVAERGHEGRIEIDSAGTHSYHEGEPPDARSIEAAARRGIDLSGQRARRVREADFETFELILAMDRGHDKILKRQAPENALSRIRMFLDYAPHLGTRDVPDPYYGAGDGFEQVLDMVEAAASGLIDAIEREFDLG
ncbi:MAG: low molecular weight phosphotyrosine protein phosphatase [Alphaproteobacteria bacterium]|nr:low molecular weight phosphotyrosine protein phosphatase [Alphaproteobacteria bacterium]